LGIWWFYRAVVVALGRPYPPAFYLLAFFPSIIFWSSILGKDPFQFLFLGLYAYGGAIWLRQGRPVAFWFIGLGIIGSFLLRPWIAILAGGSLILATLLGRCRVWQASLLLLALVPVLYFGGAQFLKDKALNDPDMVIDYAQSIPGGIVSSSGGGSGGEIVDITDLKSLGAAMPWVIFSGLFRPLVFDITNPFTALVAVQNTVVLLLAVVALSHFRLAYVREPLLLWPILYSLMWAALYGLIVMANFGSGERYRLQTWPFLLMVLVCLSHRIGRTWLDSRMPRRSSAVRHINQDRSSS